MSAATAARERTPGTEGIWTFVFIDMLVFLLIFFVFMTERLANFEQYKASQASLNAVFGFVNTLVLLTSSWMVVEAIHSAKLRQPTRVSLRLGFALGLGLLFCISKLVEYTLKIEGGISVTTNPFFTFYFFITFIHFLHVLAGMLFLLSFARSSRNCLGSDKYVTGLENVGLFWHYVDVLWIFIFPMLYLI
ncbi:MAG: cytochrome c oxidase subunit 3 [Panacagrimonas sp.]